MNISEERANLEAKLHAINASVTQEDIKNASLTELREYLKNNLKIKEKLEMLDALSNN